MGLGSDPVNERLTSLSFSNKDYFNKRIGDSTLEILLPSHELCTEDRSHEGKELEFLGETDLYHVSTPTSSLLC